MKKLISVLLCLVLVLSFGISCFADAIAAPIDDFYDNNREACERHYHYYVGVSGSISQQSPLNPMFSFRLEEGYIYTVPFTYTDSDGVVWAFVAKNNDMEDKHGWLPLDSLRPIYDPEYFYDDHEDEFIYADTIFTVDFPRGIVLYEYPGSALKWVVAPKDIPKTPALHVTWADENGVTWAQYFDEELIPYDNMNSHSLWVCLDNPLAGYDVALNSGEVEVTPDPDAKKIDGIDPCDRLPYLDDSVPEPFVPKVGKLIVCALAITACVTVLAVVLAFVLKKKR